MCRCADSCPGAPAVPPLWPQVRMRPEDFQLNPACEAEMKATRMKKRVYEILQKAMAGAPREG